MNTFDFERQLYTVIENMKSQLNARPLNLGGMTSISGGGGTPPGGFVGFLPQSRVAGDILEAAFSGIVTSGGMTLYDNLGRIRYRINQLENGRVNIIEKDGIVVASGVSILDFVGADVVETSPGNVTITITASGSGDVTGPGSSVNENIVIFNGTSGKAIKDSSRSLSEFSETGHTHSEADITDLDHNATKLLGKEISGVVPASGQVLSYDGVVWYPGSIVGTGDVVGPAGATGDNIVLFDGATGKLIKDSSKSLSNYTETGHTHSESNITDLSHDAIKLQGQDISGVIPTSGQLLAFDGVVWYPDNIAAGGDVTGPSSSVDESIVIFDGIGGKTIKDSGYDVADFAPVIHTHVETDITDLSHNAVQLQGQDISGAVPTSGQFLAFDGEAWYPGVQSGGGHTIQEEGSPLTQRTNLNFVGSTVTVTDDAGNNATIVTISPGIGSGDVIGPDTVTSGNIAVFSGTSGKLINDSGYNPADFSTIGHTHDHTLITNIGINTHYQIDTHIADSYLHEAIGFQENPAISLAFNSGTLEFSVAPSGVSSFDYYYNGTKFIKTGAQTTTVSGTGLHFIYYDADNTLKNSLVSWDIQNTVQVATVYWNGTSYLIGNELHGAQMDRKTHEYLHETVGTRYSSGLAGSFTDSTITIGGGEWYDEDMEYITSGDTSVIRVLYREGAVWKWTDIQTKYYHEVSNIIQYNNGTALADVNNNRYVAYWIYATNHIDTPFISIMGQREDISITDARNNNKPENLIFGTLPLAEMKLLYRVIVKRSGTSEVYQEATDYRTVSPVPTSNYVATDHGSLTGLQDQDHSAEAVYTTVTAFNGKLSSSDTDVQKALDTLDNHTHTESEITNLDHNALKIRGSDVSGVVPASGQVMTYDGVVWYPNTASAPGGGHTIQEEGSPLTQRSNLNFVGTSVTVTDDSANNATIVTISGGVSSGTDILMVQVFS